ncbi:MAG: response regulator [Clostridia bacterium]|nr:response regulator [Deltaproteobacteria bacterium]
MSLSGNLADLSLGDIFQIVSLARRSGTLQLETAAESGEIVFLGGKVLAASSSAPAHNVGDVLMHAGVISPLVYQEMLAEQTRGVVGQALMVRFQIDNDAVERVFEGMLTRIIYDMFEWDEGRFTFVLEAAPALWNGFSLQGGRVVLTRGLNPQYLAIEGARVRDEKERKDPLDAFLAKSRPPRESSSQATAELSSALRGDDETSFADSAGTDENIIPFPVAKRAITSEFDIPPPPAPFAPRPTLAPAPILTAPGAALPPRPTALVPPVGLVIPPDSIFATKPARSSALKDWHLVVVDDDSALAKLIARELADRFTQTHVASRASDAKALLQRLQSESLAVVIDLIMPRSDGKGILGGVEVLENVRQTSALTPVVMFTDYRNEEAEVRARSLGVDAFLMKPRRTHVFAAADNREPSESARGFVAGLRDALDALTREEPKGVPAGYPFTGAPKPPTTLPLAVPATLTPLDNETLTLSDPALDAHLDSIVGEGVSDFPYETPRAEMQNLRSMLAELIDPANRDTITLLVLRFASDVVERASLFLATRKAFVGLGGFSHSEGSDTFVSKVRKIQVPVGEESVFAKVAQYRSVVHGPLVANAANRKVLEGLGGPWHAFPTLAAPIISGDRVAAILFGDNPSGKPLGATEGLEIFLQQAGLAMDRALLERRLEEHKKSYT